MCCHDDDHITTHLARVDQRWPPASAPSEITVRSLKVDACHFDNLNIIDTVSSTMATTDIPDVDEKLYNVSDPLLRR